MLLVTQQFSRAGASTFGYEISIVCNLANLSRNPKVGPRMLLSLDIQERTTNGDTDQRRGRRRKAFGGARHRASPGRDAKGDGYLHGNGYVVTWAIGHLVGARAAARDPSGVALVATRPAADAAGAWPLVVYEKTKDQFEIVKQILTSPKVSASSARRTPGAKAN